MLSLRDIGAAACCCSQHAELDCDQYGVGGSESLGRRTGSAARAAGLLGPVVARYLGVGQVRWAREPASQRAAVRLGRLKRCPLPPRYLRQDVGSLD
jgi:hypothetical protein